MLRLIYQSPPSALSAGGFAFIRTLLVVIAFCAAGAAVGVLAANDPTYETSIGALI